MNADGSTTVEIDTSVLSTAKINIGTKILL